LIRPLLDAIVAVMSRSWIGQIAILGGVVFALGLAGCFNRPPRHGTALLLEVQTSNLQSGDERQQTWNATLQALAKRVDRIGARFSIKPAGTNQILLKIATMPQQDFASLRRTLLRGGVLEFCLVEQRGSTLLSAEAAGSGHQNVSLKRKLPDGRTAEESYSIERPPEMIGGVKTAMVIRDSRGAPEIAFTLDAAGAKRFAEVTRDNVGRQLAILLDGELQTAPIIRSPIEQGSGVISGNYDLREAFELAGVLEAPLPAPVKIVHEEAF